MASTPTYSRRRLRAHWSEFLRANRRRILIVVVFELVVTTCATAWILRVHGAEPFATYLLGGIHVATFAMIYHVLRVVFLANNQDAVHQMRGDLGESSTRDELKRAKRRRLIWGWVDSITVASGDVDHFVVTRRGGLVAIDSKWRSAADDVERSAIAAHAAARRARNVLRHLGYFKREDTGRRRADTTIAVTPLVAVWGPMRADVPDRMQVKDVEFVAGTELLAWLRAHRSEGISRQAAKQLLRELEKFRREHEPVDVPVAATTRRPAPTSAT